MTSRTAAREESGTTGPDDSSDDRASGERTRDREAPGTGVVSPDADSEEIPEPNEPA